MRKPDTRGSVTRIAEHERRDAPRSLELAHRRRQAQLAPQRGQEPRRVREEQAPLDVERGRLACPRGGEGPADGVQDGVGGRHGERDRRGRCGGF